MYRRFYEEIATYINPTLKGYTVEVGSGMGNVKEVIPDCITTDLFPNPWLDRVEDAYDLSFSANSVANLILFDVWHHLEYPGIALDEFRRVLRVGGRLILFEPAVSWFGRVVYGLFHHEPLGLRRRITWQPPVGFDIRNRSYYAAQGNCWRMFCMKTVPDEIQGWLLCEVSFYPALAYVASGGFSGPQICPSALLPLTSALDRFLRRFPMVFATRMMVVLQKREHDF